ncbi:MAG: choice-of-anchor B family protein [Bacteroidota bacterium]
MKQTLTVAAFLLVAVNILSAQAFNTTLRSRVTYDDVLNDIWGYVAPDGTEYALVGKTNGVSIVSLADPDNAVEVASIPGQFSTWRDLKTYGQFAYIVTDQGGTTEGLTIIDLSNLPDGITFTHNNVTSPNGQTLQTAHNIYIDTLNGHAYLAGGNLNQGGMVIYDIKSAPGEASWLADGPPVYAHDVYVQDDRMYASEIFAGNMTIYDVSDLDNIFMLGTIETPFSFTHNIWSTADGNYAFTTDERGNAPVGAYDISDPATPELIDEFRPGGSIGSGVIPHNVHVIDEYLSISYYTDGLVVADASVPDNVIEVAYYDTWPAGDGGFNGCWGAYPYLPSGLTLATDRNNGLFVIDVDYKRAARIKGTVTDAETGLPLNDVTISLSSPEAAPTFTNASGLYASGVATAGSYTITIAKQDYSPLTATVELENGEELVFDAELGMDFVTLAGEVINAQDQSGVEGAQVVLQNIASSYVVNADENGVINLQNVAVGTYDVYAAKWGFQNILLEDVEINGENSLQIQLVPGFRDGFILDQGWTTGSDQSTSSGFWERGRPQGTAFEGDQSNPSEDADGPTDIGNFAYVTGNAGGSAGNDDIDGGRVFLFSPSFDGTSFDNPVVKYQYWFFNAGGDSAPNDYLRIEISDGTETVLVREYTDNTTDWMVDSFNIAAFISPTETMQIIVTSTDQTNTGHLVEAGFDDFEIFDAPISSTEEITLVGLEAIVFPNPSQEGFALQYRLPTTPRQTVSLEIINTLGQTVEQRQLGATQAATVNLGFDWPSGAYFARLFVDGQLAYTTKLVKE